MLKSKRKLKLH